MGHVLMDLLMNHCKNTQISPIQRRFFNDSRGIELVKQLGISECSNIDSSILHKFIYYLCLYIII